MRLILVLKVSSISQISYVIVLNYASTLEQAIALKKYVFLVIILSMGGFEIIKHGLQHANDMALDHA